MTSIRRELIKGLLGAAIVSTLILLFYVLNHYGFLVDFPNGIAGALLEVRDHVAMPITLFLLLFGLGSFFVVTRIERQFQTAARSVSEAANDLTSYRLGTGNFPAELHPFIMAIDTLLLRLETHASLQEAFAEDAAHELKNPLAILALEMDRLPDKDPDIDKAKMKAQIFELSDMVDQLLLLARSNSPDIKHHKTPVSPADIAEKLVTQMAPKAIQSGKNIALDVTRPKDFCGLPEAVTAALRTLIVNALRVTPSGGTVTLIAGPEAQISILDGGPGLSDQALSSLKGRGVRADQVPGGSAGLGLTIADRIIEAHGGDIKSLIPDTVGLKVVFTPIS